MTALFEMFAEILLNGAIVLGIFVVLLLNNKEARKSRANIFLSVLLIALTFSIFHIRYAGYVLSHLRVGGNAIGDPTFLIIAPLLWLYVRELTGKKTRHSGKMYLHALPFLFVVCTSQFLTPIRGDSHLFLHGGNRLGSMLFWTIVLAQFSTYMVLIQREWKRYQTFLQEEVSNTENVNFSWVRFFMAVFLVINAFFLFSLFAVIHLDCAMWLWKAVGVVFAISIISLGYKGILQKEIFHIDRQDETSLPTEVVVKPDQNLLEQLQLLMSQRKLFLDPELTLSKLAVEVGISRTQLSQTINAGTGDNFYDFVNKYRVEEVKRLMKDSSVDNFNLLGIGLEAGFKSKSTFNLTFKRFTGLTPSAYKKNSA